MQEHEFLALFNELCVAYRQEFDQERGLVYFKYLHQFSLTQFQKAVEQLIFHGGKFLPTIAEIVEIINPPNVGRAWENVLSVASGGCRLWEKLSDTEIATVSAIGGIGLVQNSTEEGLPFLCRDFKNAYPGIIKRGVKYNSDEERLKDLNMIPETYLFIKKSREMREVEGERQERPKILEQMLGKIGKAIE